MKDSLKKISFAKKNLAKLNNISGTSELNTLLINNSKLLGTVPETWCPKINKQVRVEDVPALSSKKIININGGTP